MWADVRSRSRCRGPRRASVLPGGTCPRRASGCGRTAPPTAACLPRRSSAKSIYRPRARCGQAAPDPHSCLPVASSAVSCRAFPCGPSVTTTPNYSTVRLYYQYKHRSVASLTHTRTPIRRCPPYPWGMEDQLRLGRRVRRWRIRRGLTQEALASLAGITQSYLSKIEAGTVVCDRRSVLVALAVALSVSVGDLVGRPGDPTSPAKIAASASVPLVAVAMVCRRVEGAQLTAAPTDSLTATVATVADALAAIQTSDYVALG